MGRFTTPEQEARLDTLRPGNTMRFTPNPKRGTLYTAVIIEGEGDQTKLIRQCPHQHIKYKTTMACADKLLANFKRGVRRGEISF